jgi:phospholipid/cholesterol/gamma-HCH transport system substrate-binding protein
MEVDRDAPMNRGTFATLSFQGVTGLAFIQLADHGKNAPRLQPNDEVPPRIPLEPGLLSRLEERGEVILDRVNEVAGRVNTLLGDSNQKRIAAALDNIARTASTTSELATSLNSTVKQRLDPALQQATVTLKGAQHTVDQVGAAAAQFGETAQRLNAKGGPIDRIGEGTDALAHAAESFSATTLPRINRATEETTRAVRSVHRAVDELTENPQMLIYGAGTAQPGPGEPGFQAPGARR